MPKPHAKHKLPMPEKNLGRPWRPTGRASDRLPESREKLDAGGFHFKGSGKAHEGDVSRDYLLELAKPVGKPRGKVISKKEFKYIQQIFDVRTHESSCPWHVVM